MDSTHKPIEERLDMENAHQEHSSSEKDAISAHIAEDVAVTLKSKTPSEQALHRLFDTLENNELMIGADEIVRLQQQNPIEVTPELRARALAALPRFLHPRDFEEERSKEYIRVFRIMDEEVREAAAKRVHDVLEKIQADPSDPFNKSKELFIREMCDTYGVTSSGPASHLMEAQMTEACMNGVPLDKMANLFNPSLFSQLRPHIVENMLYKAMLNPDRSVFAAVQKSLVTYAETSADVIPAYVSIITKHPEEVLLDLSLPNELDVLQACMQQQKKSDCMRQNVNAFLEKIGIDNKAFMRTCWDSSNNTEKYKDRIGTPIVIRKNLEAIGAIEKILPGACKYLHDAWGITAFHRYPTQLLAEQAASDRKGEKPEKNQKKVLVVYPSADWSGSFDTNFVENFAKQAQEKKSFVRFAEAGKKNGCLRRVMRYANTFGTIDLAVLGGHSDGSKIYLGSGKADGDTISIDDIRSRHLTAGQQKVIERMRASFDPSGKIIFKSCSVGKKGGFADQASRLLDVDTQGPVLPAGSVSIDLDDNAAAYRADGKPTASRIFKRPSQRRGFFQKMPWNRKKSPEGI